jgi:hypothetical protein
MPDENDDFERRIGPQGCPAELLEASERRRLQRGSMPNAESRAIAQLVEEQHTVVRSVRECTWRGELGPGRIRAVGPSSSFRTMGSILTVPGQMSHGAGIRRSRLVRPWLVGASTLVPLLMPVMHGHGV